MKNKIIILLVIPVLLILGWRFAAPFRVSGDCMEPAFIDGKVYFLNRISPYIRHYQLGDTILFMHEEKVWISRIVALENNTVQITEGHVVIDGSTLPDSGIQRNWAHWKLGTYAIDAPFKVPPQHVFVLSDNLSAEHDDSRVFGPIALDSIRGLVW